MKRWHWWNPRLSIVSLCILVWIIHAVLKFTLAEHDIVSTIFAAGAHLPRWMVSCAVLFAVIRVFVLIMVPGLLAWRTAIWVMGRLNRTEATASRKGFRWQTG